MSDPTPFNPDYRPGYGAALSLAYRNWCRFHPESTQEDRRVAYAELAKQLETDFPKHGEIE
jgi:hypothetical protein